jgi:hypothetical protein
MTVSRIRVFTQDRKLFVVYYTKGWPGFMDSGMMQFHRLDNNEWVQIAGGVIIVIEEHQGPVIEPQGLRDVD